MDTGRTPDVRHKTRTRRLFRTSPVLTRLRAWLLVLVALLSFGAIGIFIDLAEDVETADHITVVDLQWADWLHAHATPVMTQIMLAVSALHDTLSISTLSILVACFLIWRRENGWLLGLILAVPGGILVNTFFKFLFARARPHFVDPIVTLTSYSFPSGHVAASTLFYGFVAAFVVSRTYSLAVHIAAVIGALLLVLLVAASRMYLGAHFLSDVLAAFFESFAWLGLCLVGIHLIRGWNARQPKRLR